MLGEEGVKHVQCGLDLSWWSIRAVGETYRRGLHCIALGFVALWLVKVASNRSIPSTPPTALDLSPLTTSCPVPPDLSEDAFT